MAIIDNKYRDLLKKIHDVGFTYEDENRSGVFRRQISDHSFAVGFSYGKQFPAITTKKLAWKSVVGELLWFLRGDTNIKYLVDNNIHIWNKDAYNYAKRLGYTGSMSDFLIGVKAGTRHSWLPLGQLGRVYGAQWRNFSKLNLAGEVDQIANLIGGLRDKPMATDHIVTAWNPAESAKMALKPCHFGFQILPRPLSRGEQNILLGELGATWNEFISNEDWNRLCTKWNIPKYGFTLKWHQRSTDVFLGLPFNIASYALLANILGKMTNMMPLGIIGSLSNVHIYSNAIGASHIQIGRDVSKHPSPKLKFSPRAEELFKHFRDTGMLNLNEIFDSLEIEDFILDGYESDPHIKVEMLAYDN